MENKTIRGCGYWEHEGIIPSISSANTESQKATGKAAISGCDCPPLSYCLWFCLSNYGTILMSKKKLNGYSKVSFGQFHACWEAKCFPRLFGKMSF